MKYLTIDHLKKMRACSPARKAFTSLFGDKAKVTLANVETFLGPAYEPQGYIWGDWFINKLLFRASKEVRKAFRERALLYLHPYTVPRQLNYTDFRFDSHRTHAVYELLKAVELK